MQRTITLDRFSGPLDQLLLLVEEEKLSINDISLSKVADQYVAQIKETDILSKEELATFLVIAATLILIKSRSLLPDLSLSEAEEESIDELKRRLRMYQFFKMLTANLIALQRRAIRLVGREAYAGLQTVFLPPENITVKKLYETLANLAKSLPEKEMLPSKTMESAVSLEEIIIEIQKRIESALVLSFEDVKKQAKGKIEIIISFLALLELFKQGVLLFEQNEAFGTIKLQKKL